MLGVSIARIKTETIDTTCVANTSPSAASADLNGKATKLACQAPERVLTSLYPEFAAVEKLADSTV